MNAASARIWNMPGAVVWKAHFFLFPISYLLPTSIEIRKITETDIQTYFQTRILNSSSSSISHTPMHPSSSSLTELAQIGLLPCVHADSPSWNRRRDSKLARPVLKLYEPRYEPINPLLLFLYDFTPLFFFFFFFIAKFDYEIAIMRSSLHEPILQHVYWSLSIPTTWKRNHSDRIPSISGFSRGRNTATLYVNVNSTLGFLLLCNGERLTYEGSRPDGSVSYDVQLQKIEKSRRLNIVMNAKQPLDEYRQRLLLPRKPSKMSLVDFSK